MIKGNLFVTSFSKTYKLLLFMFIFFIIWLSFRASNVDFIELFKGFSDLSKLIKGMFPPKFGNIPKIAILTLETIGIGFWGTIIGSFLAIPLGFLCAKNTSPNRFMSYFAVIIVNVLRSVPEIVYALIFVVSFGMGPLAGLISIALTTVGMLSKFIAEMTEGIDPKPVEAVKATGSKQIAIITHSVVPQILPLFIGYYLYLIDSNIRTAMSLGIIGAGGLGVELVFHMSLFHYQKFCGILVIMYIIITFIDRISQILRKGVLEGTLFRQKKTKTKEIMAASSFIFVGIVSLFFIPTNLTLLAQGGINMAKLIPMYFPPVWVNWSNIITKILETLAIAVSGTVFAIIIAIPLGILAARNLFHIKWIRIVVIEICNFFRSIPDLVFALIFVSAVGLGPFPGVIGLGIHTAGFLGKIYAEAIENVDLKPLEAVQATGAHFFQRIRHCIIPQIIPSFTSNSLYIFDRNIRASTILGVIGAGGIGFELVANMRSFEYNRVMGLVIIILVLIIIVDRLSSSIRSKVV